MSEKILVPALGESITEATVAKWLKNAGDPVEADEPVVELETDKVNLEVPSPIAGVLSEINEKDGSVVAVGALLGSISQNDVKTSIKKIEEIKGFIVIGEQLFDDVKITLEKHWKDFMEIFDKKNLARKECLLLPLRTIAKALKI